MPPAENLTSGELFAARAARQHLTPSTRGSSDGDYLAIVRELGPLRPPSYAFPGTPVLLHDRHEGDPLATGERVRRERRVFKARFQHGNVAYVASDDVALYAAAFAKPLPDAAIDEAQAIVETLAQEGPLHRSDLAAVSGIKGRLLSATLQALQLAFVVFEDQTDTAWDNPWALIETERPKLLDALPERFEARVTVLERFLRSYLLVTPQEAADWSGWPRREVAGLLEELLAAGRARHACLDGERGYYLASDYEPVRPEPCLAVLDLGDPLSTAQAKALRPRFPGPNLKFVLLDGEIVGAVQGRWGIKPFDVDDVIVPEALLAAPWREELIASLREHFPPPQQRILNYGGEPLDAMDTVTRR